LLKRISRSLSAKDILAAVARVDHGIQGAYSIETQRLSHAHTSAANL
jgi:hypothetical protein